MKFSEIRLLKLFCPWLCILIKLKGPRYFCRNFMRLMWNKSIHKCKSNCLKRNVILMNELNKYNGQMCIFCREDFSEYIIKEFLGRESLLVRICFSCLLSAARWRHNVTAAAPLQGSTAAVLQLKRSPAPPPPNRPAAARQGEGSAVDAKALQLAFYLRRTKRETTGHFDVFWDITAANR